MSLDTGKWCSWGHGANRAELVNDEQAIVTNLFIYYFYLLLYFRLGCC
jgi:hypothetical protein